MYHFISHITDRDNCQATCNAPVAGNGIIGESSRHDRPVGPAGKIAAAIEGGHEPVVSERVDNFHAPFLRSNWQSAFDDVRVVTRKRERESLKNARQIAGLQDFEFEAIFGLEEPGITGWLRRNDFIRLWAIA